MSEAEEIAGLVAFIKARLAEDKATAEACRYRKWRVGGEVDVHADDPWGGPMDEEDAVHIARHDPACVLRTIEGKRRILARYEDCLQRTQDPAYPHAAARDQAREYEDFVLPNLAADWEGHPDYRQELKP